MWSCSFQLAPLESSAFYNNTTSMCRLSSRFTYLSTVNGGCYKVVTRRLNWTDAGLNCRAIHKDAHLLVINDAAEQSAVAGMMTSISSLYQFSFRVLSNISVLKNSIEFLSVKNYGKFYRNSIEFSNHAL